MNTQQRLIDLTNSRTGVEIFIVGGYVRDRLLNIECKDHDFVVIGVSEQDMISLGFRKVGAGFPVFLAPNGDEYALARKEVSTGDGYGDFTTETAGVTLEDDLMRRDLTINALARRVVGFTDEGYAVLDDKIHDFCGGLRDLNNGILRHVSDAFADDPLRVLRVARFAARYMFDVHPSTTIMMATIVKDGKMKSLPIERVWAETAKALDEEYPREFWEVIDSVHAFKDFDHGINLRYVASHAEYFKMRGNIHLHCAMMLHDRGVKGISMLEKLCPPTKFVRYAKAMQYCFNNMTHKADTITATGVLYTLHSLGAFKRPDEFYEIMQGSSKLNQIWSNTMQQCLLVATDVTFNELSQTDQETLSGPRIKEAIVQLQEERLTAFLRYLNNIQPTR